MYAICTALRCKSAYSQYRSYFPIGNWAEHVIQTSMSLVPIRFSTDVAADAAAADARLSIAMHLHKRFVCTFFSILILNSSEFFIVFPTRQNFQLNP